MKTMKKLPWSQLVWGLVVLGVGALFVFLPYGTALATVFIVGFVLSCGQLGQTTMKKKENADLA